MKMFAHNCKTKKLPTRFKKQKTKKVYLTQGWELAHFKTYLNFRAPINHKRPNESHSFNLDILNVPSPFKKRILFMDVVDSE